MYSKLFSIVVLLLFSVAAFLSGCEQGSGPPPTGPVDIQIEFPSGIPEGAYLVKVTITAPDMDTFSEVRLFNIESGSTRISISVWDIPSGEDRHVDVGVSKDGEGLFAGEGYIDVSLYGSNSLIVRVDKSGEHKLVADFELVKSEVNVGEAVQVDARKSYDTHFDIEVAWDWGDGTDSLQQLEATHIYSEAGTYIITLTVRSEPGDSVESEKEVTVISSGTSRFVVGMEGKMLIINSEGKVEDSISIDGRGVEVYDGRIFILRDDGRSIIEFDEKGNELNTISIPYCVNFTVLPDLGFALLDNSGDRIYFVDSGGKLLKTVNILEQKDRLLQNLDGIVVGNSLIVSEDGNNRIIEVDLKSYEMRIFRDLTSLSGWLGAIDCRDGVYYICQAKDIYSFSERQAAKHIATLDRSNITGIVVVGDFAFVTVNFSGEICRVNILTGKTDLLLGGLDNPVDIERF